MILMNLILHISLIFYRQSVYCDKNMFKFVFGLCHLSPALTYTHTTLTVSCMEGVVALDRREKDEMHLVVRTQMLIIKLHIYTWTTLEESLNFHQQFKTKVLLTFMQWNSQFLMD